MSPDRYVHSDWPWWHKAITDLRLYLVLIAALSLYSVVLGTAARSKAQESITTLVNCTTPHHKCYDNGQKQTGGAIAAIQKANIYANYCAVHLAQTRTTVTVPRIEKCVNDLLAKDAKAAGAK